MQRVLYHAAAIILLTAAMAIALWVSAGITPIMKQHHNDTITRSILTFPLFWALLAAAIIMVIVIIKRDRFNGGKVGSLTTSCRKARREDSSTAVTEVRQCALAQRQSNQ